MKARAVGGIEAVVKAISAHINNTGVCYRGCGALLNMTYSNGKNTEQIKMKQTKWVADNQVKAGTAGGIEAVVKAINTHIGNANVYYAGCYALWKISEGIASFQKEACEKGGLTVFFESFKRVLR